MNCYQIPSHEEMQDARDQAMIDAWEEYEDEFRAFNECGRCDLRDDGRSGGYGESYAERNA